jgi:hypothetical protein
MGYESGYEGEFECFIVLCIIYVYHKHFRTPPLMTTCILTTCRCTSNMISYARPHSLYSKYVCMYNEFLISVHSY